MERQEIASDCELSHGIAAYNDALGRWWYAQAMNAVHTRAYRNIAAYIHASFGGSPGLIVDYACGAGHLLSRLCWRFPHSRLMGLDGSSYLLGLARRRLTRMGRSRLDRIALVETELPNFELARGVADLVVFAFPNMVPCSREEDLRRRLDGQDLALSRDLAQACDRENARQVGHREAASHLLLSSRLVSLNHRSLLKRGGICVRVEYGSARRHELSRIQLLQAAFEEGALDADVNGNHVEQWFRVLASAYFRSGVIEDVYHQTGDKQDKKGGYIITILRAL